MELWDEEMNVDIHCAGILTLPEMELPFDDMAEMIEIRRVVAEIIAHDKFPIVLGGEHSITSPVVAALTDKHPGLSVLRRFDAHADLRDSYMGTRFNHAA
jgi:agmatinase